jgi:hypothetical protein
MTTRNLQTAIRLLAVMIATYALAPSFAQEANIAIHQDVVAFAQPKVIEASLLMDTDRNGKISKETL